MSPYEFLAPFNQAQRCGHGEEVGSGEDGRGCTRYVHKFYEFVCFVSAYRANLRLKLNENVIFQRDVRRIGFSALLFCVF